MVKMVMTDTVPVRQPLDPVFGEEVEGPQAGNENREKDGKADGFQFHVQPARMREFTARTATHFPASLKIVKTIFPKAGK